LHFTANQGYDAEKPPTAIEVDDLEVKENAEPLAENRRSWRVSLGIELAAQPDRNLVGSFAIKIAGDIAVDQSVKDENIERFIRINGNALVFSAAREIIRDLTSRGPNKAILLPTVTFWEPKTEPAVAASDVGEVKKRVDETATNAR
jgi:preprotein translocase subunit SecB